MHIAAVELVIARLIPYFVCADLSLVARGDSLHEFAPVIQVGWRASLVRAIVRTGRMKRGRPRRCLSETQQHLYVVLHREVRQPVQSLKMPFAFPWLDVAPCRARIPQSNGAEWNTWPWRGLQETVYVHAEICGRNFSDGPLYLRCTRRTLDR